MILLLGATGYVGQAFASELRRRGHSFIPLTRKAIDYTRFEEDDIVTKIAPKVVGWYVSDKLKPVTDKAVDKAADFVNARREARAAKKNKTTE